MLETMLRERTLRSASGDPLRVDHAPGTVLVVNFWATWCRPCRREMPLLDTLHDRLAGRGGVVAISVDHDLARVARFVERNRLHLPVFVDGPEGMARDLDLATLPATFVLDGSGRIVYRCAGIEEQTLGELNAAVDRVLEETTLPTAEDPS